MNIFNQTSLRTQNNLSYFEIPEMAKLEWVRHAFLTRKGGVSLPPHDSLNLSDREGDREENVSRNNDLVTTAFGFDLKRLILLNQIHREKILILKEPILTLPPPLEYDAMITSFSNQFLGILTADCIPIFVVDQRRKVIAAVHAGRQGTTLHITKKVLKKMEEEFGCSSEDLIIAMGPSIGGCCYEIDEKSFQSEWEPFSIPKGKGKWMVDLTRININQIKKEGVKEDQIFRIDLCTSCHNDLFFSYRKEGQTGRQLSFIGII
jgi:YfiH family protein